MSKRKNPSSDDNLNADFCEFLMELAEYEKNVNRNIHKYNAYRKAASVLTTHYKRIQSGEEAKKLNGIGEKISKKIDEFIHTGKLRKLENIHQDENAQAINLLTRVSGIGPVKAAELVRNGIKTLEDLKNNKNKLNHHQQIGLKYFDDFEKKIPRTEIKDIETKIRSIINAMDTDYNITICGSYRRGKQESGDIDMLITHKSYKIKIDKKYGDGDAMLKKIITALQDIITDTLSIGDTKFMVNKQFRKYHRLEFIYERKQGVCRLSPEHPPRRLDIRLVTSEQYYCAVLYFTGSDVFNKTMRTHALDKGFTLNEYTLRHLGTTGVPGEPVPISSEENIFDYIDYPFKKPEERNM